MNASGWNYQNLVKWIVAIEAACLLVACGGGGGYGGGGGGGGGGDTPKYSIQGTISNLHGTVVLRNNNRDDLSLTADGAFRFATALDSGAAYAVTVQTQPASQECSVTNGTGTVGTSNVTTVAVACIDTPEVVADPGVRSATLTWNAPAGATQFNVHVSSTPHCDVANVAACDDHALIENVSPPLTVDRLRNGQTYFFQLETVFGTGERVMSPETFTKPNSIAFNGRVGAIAAGRNGTRYVAGNFTRAGVTGGAVAALSLKSGRSAIPEFPTVSGPVVYAIAADPAGRVYLGGVLSAVDREPVASLVRIDANGAYDPSFHVDLDHGLVQALALSPDGKRIYVAGNFTTANGEKHERIAAFNDDGTLVPGWTADADSRVWALAVDPNGVLYAGGEFTEVNQVSRNRLVALNSANGEVLQQWDAGLVGDVVNALQISQGILYVGGDYTEVVGRTRNHLAALRTTRIDAPAAAELLDWAPTVDDDFASVNAIAVDPEIHAAYVGGFFRSISGVLHDNLAAIGTPDHPDHAGAPLPWSADTSGGPAGVTTLAVSGSTIIAGGLFEQVNGKDFLYAAAITRQGEVIEGWRPAPNSFVHSTLVSGAIVYIGGEFNGLFSTERNRLAALDKDDSLLPWNPNVSSGNAVWALAVTEDTVFAAGSFSEVGDRQHNNIVAIEATGAGATREGFAVGTDDGVLATDDTVWAVAVRNDVLYFGGAFNTVTAGQVRSARQRLAAVSTAGVLLDTWKPAVDDGRIRTMVATQDSVVIGGSFTSITPDGAVAQPHHGLAVIGSVNSAGPLAPGALADWDANVFGGGGVTALDVANGLIYFGGDFTEACLERRSRLVAISMENVSLGTCVLSDTWKPALDFGGVDALQVAGDAVYFGGFGFAAIDGVPRRGLAAVDFNGFVTDWDPARQKSVSVHALSVSDDSVTIGGFFSELGGALQLDFGSVSATGTGGATP